MKTAIMMITGATTAFLIRVWLGQRMPHQTWPEELRLSATTWLLSIPPGVFLASLLALLEVLDHSWRMAGPNAAHHWRRARDVKYETETSSRRPVHVRC